MKVITKPPQCLKFNFIYNLSVLYLLSALAATDCIFEICLVLLYLYDYGLLKS